MACGILVPWPRIETISPAVEGWFLTTEPPGKSLVSFTISKSKSVPYWGESAHPSGWEMARGKHGSGLTQQRMCRDIHGPWWIVSHNRYRPRENIADHISGKALTPNIIKNSQYNGTTMQFTCEQKTQTYFTKRYIRWRISTRKDVQHPSIRGSTIPMQSQPSMTYLYGEDGHLLIVASHSRKQRGKASSLLSLLIRARIPSKGLPSHDLITLQSPTS